MCSFVNQKIKYKRNHFQFAAVVESSVASVLYIASIPLCDVPGQRSILRFDVY